MWVLKNRVVIVFIKCYMLVMDFTKRFSFFGIYVYVSSHRLKRRGRREDYYRKHRKRLLRLKRRVYRKSGGVCGVCGCRFSIDALEVHHIIPLRDRPDLLLCRENVALLCHACHLRVHKGL